MSTPAMDPISDLYLHAPRASRRALFAALAGGALLPGQARGQQTVRFPARPVRIVSGFSPGGPTDVLARVLGDRLTRVWQQPVVVENRPGAGGNIGAEHVARAAPDGHTLLLVSSAHVQTPPLVPRLPYDPLRSFTPIMQIAYYPMALCVLPGFPAQNLAEFIAHASPGPAR